MYKIWLIFLCSFLSFKIHASETAWKNFGKIVREFCQKMDEQYGLSCISCNTELKGNDEIEFFFKSKNNEVNPLIARDLENNAKKIFIKIANDNKKFMQEYELNNDLVYIYVVYPDPNKDAYMKKLSEQIKYLDKEVGFYKGEENSKKP